MPTQPTRTASPVPEPSVLTTEQQRRVEAIFIARRALEETSSAGAFTRPAQAAPMIPDLLEAADWILTGTKVERLDEHPEHVSMTNLGTGQYTEVERDAPAIATVTMTTMDDTGAGFIHANDLDGTRLCDLSGGLGTVMWQAVDCPACEPIMVARTQAAADRADVAAAVGDLEEREAAGEQLTERPLIHLVTKDDPRTACGIERQTLPPNSTVEAAHELVSCHSCRIVLDERKHYEP